MLMKLTFLAVYVTSTIFYTKADSKLKKEKDKRKEEEADKQTTLGDGCSAHVGWATTRVPLEFYNVIVKPAVEPPW